MRDYLILFILVLFISSCSYKNKPTELEDSMSLKENNIGISTITYKGVPTLKFSNMEQFNSLVEKFKSLTSKDQMNRSKTFGIKTFYECFNSIEKKIDEQLKLNPKSFLTDTSFTSFKNKTLKYALYSEADIYPELKAKSIIEANIANELGLYFIGNKLYHIDLFRNTEELRKYSILSKPVDNFRTNNAFAKTEDRKARLEIRIDPHYSTLTLRFSAQREYGWLISWWARYETIFSSTITIHQTNYDFDVFKNELYQYISLKMKGGSRKKQAPFTIKKNTTDKTIILKTKELDGVTFIPFGQFIYPKDSSSDEYNEDIVMKGKMEIWSRGVPYKNRSSDLLDIKIPINL